MKTHTLVIVFNEFYPDKATSYVELVTEDGDLVEEKQLKRRPTAARFNAVYENGSGSHNQWNAHKARRLHGHRLQK